MRRLTSATVALALGLALAACGVPSQSGVIPEGPGQEVAPAQGAEGTSEPPARDATTDPSGFAKNFLLAAAGAPEQAQARLQEWLSPLVNWDPEPDVHIVRLRGEPTFDEDDRGTVARFNVTHLGVLGQNGIVVPEPARNRTYTIAFAELEQGKGLFVTDLPNEVVLADSALTTYYDQRTIYFWSADGRTLVPDLRYLPRRDVPPAQYPMQIIDWLLAGPSPWLEGTVQSLPPEARRVGNVPVSSGSPLEVQLTRAADTDDVAQVDRLATQLRWSLRVPGGGDPSLVLRVDRISKPYRDDSYLAFNPAYRGDRGRVRLLCLQAGRLRALLPDGEPAIPQLPAPYDQGLLRAALGREGERTVAAVVKAGSGGRQVLGVASGPGPVLAQPRWVDLRADRFGQPVWLSGDPAIGLVIADGVLYSFGPQGQEPKAVPGAPRNLTAFAVPPDGRRLAYVRNGKLYVGALIRNGDSVAVDADHEIPTLLGVLSGVGWSGQQLLMVAGEAGNGLQFHDVSVDGAVHKLRARQSGATRVSHLVATADDPVDGAAEGQLLYEVNGVAYELFTEVRGLTAADVGGGPSPQPGTGANPRSPFFLD